MTKGNLDPKYVKGYTKEEIDELKAKWVEPKEHEKESKDMKVWNEFLQYEYEKNSVSTVVVRGDALDYWMLRKYVKDFCLTKCGLWSGQAAYYFKMIIYTYAMKYDVKIPKFDTVETASGVKLIPIKIDPIM